MRAHELFQKMGPEKAAEILGFFRENDRNVYRTTLATLTQNRNLRAVFVQQKPVPEQMAWMRKELGARRSDAVAEQMLQVWLLQAREAMLVQFLDAMGVEHNGKGAVDDLPETLDAEKLKDAVAGLIDKFGAVDTALYLNIFQNQTREGWPELAAVLAGHPDLQFPE